MRALRHTGISLHLPGSARCASSGRRTCLPAGATGSCRHDRFRVPAGRRGGPRRRRQEGGAAIRRAGKPRDQRPQRQMPSTGTRCRSTPTNPPTAAINGVITTAGRRHRAQAARADAARAAARGQPSLEEPAGDHPEHRHPDRPLFGHDRWLPVALSRPAAVAGLLAGPGHLVELARRRPARAGAGQVGRYVADPARHLRIEGVNPYLNPNAALHIGLALHELAVNSVSYGALSKADGFVTITAEIGEAVHLTLDVARERSPPHSRRSARSASAASRWSASCRRRSTARRRFRSARPSSNTADRPGRQPRDWK